MARMLRSCQRIAAHLLACGVKFAYRWVPPELNPADHDSRRSERLVLASAESASRDALLKVAFPLATLSPPAGTSDRVHERANLQTTRETDTQAIAGDRVSAMADTRANLGMLAISGSSLRRERRSPGRARELRKRPRTPRRRED